MRTAKAGAPAVCFELPPDKIGLDIESLAAAAGSEILAVDGGLTTLLVTFLRLDFGQCLAPDSGRSADSSLGCETTKSVCPRSYFEHANGPGRSISTVCQAGILSVARPRGRTNQNNG